MSKKEGTQKRKWTDEEDQELQEITKRVGIKKWSVVAKEMTTCRTGKQCRERYINHFAPNVKIAPWSKAEDIAIVQLQRVLPNKWVILKHSKALQGRTASAIKTRWNSYIKRRVQSNAYRDVDTSIHAYIRMYSDLPDLYGLLCNPCYWQVRREPGKSAGSVGSVGKRSFHHLEFDHLEESDLQEKDEKRRKTMPIQE